MAFTPDALRVVRRQLIPLIKIHYRKVDLRDKVKTADGQWQPQGTLWKLPHETVINAGLGNRIIRFVMSNQA